MAHDRRERLRLSEVAARSLGQPTGKRLESALLRKAFTLLGCRNLNLEEREKPDFLVTADSIRIGCEVTELYIRSPIDELHNGSGEARLWAIWERFAQKLGQDLVATDDVRLASLYGAVHLRSFAYRALDAVNLTELRREIVSLVSSQPDDAWLTEFDPVMHPILTRNVAKIWNAHIVDSSGPLWWLAGLRTGRVQDPGPAIEHALRKKAAKSLTYAWPDACHRWLLVIARGRGIYDSVPFPCDIECPAVDHTFSAIVLAELSAGYVQQLFPE
jgi:hypothetical protein